MAFFAAMLFNTAVAQKKGSAKKNKSTLTETNDIVIKYGLASFYADKFHGRKTASGENYHRNKLTAACNMLPLNTWVKVTNTSNDRSVIVKINDRLHSKNKRLVDLSFSAAKELGYISKGLTKVKVEVLHDFEIGMNIP